MAHYYVRNGYYYYLYVSQDRSFSVRPSKPVFDETLFAYKHPTSGDRLLGVGTLKHDTTTGGNVQGGVPEIMVAYKDGQGYPEYLVTFTL